MRHDALLYASADELVAGVQAFVAEGAAAGEPLLVALPAGTRALLAPLLPATAEVRAMEQLGSNPGRLIPQVGAWATEHPDAGPVRVLGQADWPGRPPAELAEQAVHEALVDEAWAGLPLTALCLYDLRRIDPALRRDVERTHRTVCCGGAAAPSARYGEDLETPLAPLAAPPQDAVVVPVSDGPRRVRNVARELTMRAGLGRDRSDEALVAINEAATNALLHGGAGGSVHLWVDDRALVCEVAGGGQIADPLAGRRPPHHDSPGGRGLWLIHHLCDLVHVRSTGRGTVVRLHVRRAHEHAA